MMNSDKSSTEGSGWEDLGRAAERFARRLARDTGTFAERIQEHAGEFARDVSRDWKRHTGPWSSHGCREKRGPADVRRVFDELREMLSGVVEGVDEFVDRVFPERENAAAETWVRMVHNRDAICAKCGRTITAGEEGFVRRASTGKEFRCLGCGVSPSTTEPAG